MNESERPDTTSAARLDVEVSLGSPRDQEFREFYLANTEHLVGFLVVRKATVSDAADIAQETMTAAYKRWDTIDHPPRLGLPSGQSRPDPPRNPRA